MIDINTIDFKDKYDMYNRMQNKKRQLLLAFIYEAPRNYTQLKEFSGLKPGSLYHHLNILIPLIEKKGHGVYEITEYGKEIVEELKLVNKLRPKISNTTIEPDTKNEDMDLPKIKVVRNEEESSEQEIETNNDEVKLVDKLDIKHDEITEETDLTINWDDPLAALWLGTPSYIIFGIILLISIILATQGIALAGSAIYAVNNIAFVFDLFAFIIGIGLLYYIELGIYRNQVYSKLKYITIIRVLSMLPAAVMGLGIILLTLSGVIISSAVIPWIFTISIIFGTLFAASGISYLRGFNIYRSLIIASVPSFMDLFLGIIIILS